MNQDVVVTPDTLTVVVGSGQPQLTVQQNPAGTVTVAPQAAPQLTIQDGTTVALTPASQPQLTIQQGRVDVISVGTQGPTGASGAVKTPVTMTYAASLTPDAGHYSLVTVVLTGNTTIQAPAGSVTDGQQLIFRFVQDSAGARTVAWGSGFRFSSGVAPILSTAPGATDYIGFLYNAPAAAWDCTAQRGNF